MFRFWLKRLRLRILFIFGPNWKYLLRFSQLSKPFLQWYLLYAEGHKVEQGVALMWRCVRLLNLGFSWDIRLDHAVTIKIVIIINNTSAEIKTKSADVLLKMIIIYRTEDRATVFLKWTDFNQTCYMHDLTQFACFIGLIKSFLYPFLIDILI